MQTARNITYLCSCQTKRLLKESLSICNMVELAGTAPASIGLFWLVFYSLSLLEKCRLPESKQTKNEQSKVQNLSECSGQKRPSIQKYETLLHYLASCAALL